MGMFSQQVERVRERIAVAPVDHYLREEARNDLARLMEAHALDMAEREMQDAKVEDPPMEGATVVNESPMVNPFAPSPKEIDMRHREMAVQLATSQVGLFNRESAQRIYAFLRTGD